MNDCMANKTQIGSYFNDVCVIVNDLPLSFAISSVSISLFNCSPNVKQLFDCPTERGPIK